MWHDSLQVWQRAQCSIEMTSGCRNVQLSPALKSFCIPERKPATSFSSSALVFGFGMLTAMVLSRLTNFSLADADSAEMPGSWSSLSYGGGRGSWSWTL